MNNGDRNEDGKRIHLLSGALRFFPASGSGDNEHYIKELADRLHGKVSDTDLAAIAAIYRNFVFCTSKGAFTK
jgi:hypothetical protein